jgi:hypothetical protein
LLEYLAEVEARGLHLKEAYSSMYDFCVRKLRLSEGSAVRHLAGARACSRFPTALESVRDGRIHLTGLEMLSRYLGSGHFLDLLAAAANKSKAEIEVTLRAWFPRPDVPERVRPVAEQPGLAVVTANSDSAAVRASELDVAAPSAASREAAHAERGRVAPRSAERFHVEFTVSAQSKDKLERALDLMSHQNPKRSVAVAFDRALDALLRDLEKKKLGKTSRPRKSQGAKFGDISRATRREVSERDAEQCSYVSEAGLRCTARAFVELDHAEARALGGSGEPENARVLCRPHNQFEARRVFGEEHVARCIRKALRLSDADHGALPPWVQCVQRTGDAALPISPRSRALTGFF